MEADAALGGSVILEVGVSPLSFDFLPFFFFFDLEVDDSAAECSASLALIKGTKPPGTVKVSDLWSVVRDFGFGFEALALLLSAFDSPSASSLDVMKVGTSVARFLLPRLGLIFPRLASPPPLDEADLELPASALLELDHDQ